MEHPTQAGPTGDLDSRSAKDRLFGDEPSDDLRKRLAKAQFMAGLSMPSGGDETGEGESDLSEGVTEASVDGDYPAEPIRVGRFTVLRKLGQGGMGVVYAAYDEELDRKVAIKLLRGELSKDDRGRVRMQREAQALARLSHPNVVQVHEMGVWQGHDFVAMEFVAGETLSRWVEAEERPWREVLAVMMGAGRGLAAAHAAGLVHRDFKPANILVGADDRPRVLDFGLARAAGDGDSPFVSELIQTGEQSVESNPESSSGDPTRSGSAAFDQLLTATGAVLGTPAYMAPEQHLGQRATELSDQFSFCLVLYEALFGERPFKARSRNAYANKVIAGQFEIPGTGAGVPAWLRQAIFRGLAPIASDRWVSMEELLAELGRERARKWTRLGLVAASLAAAVGIGMLLVPSDPVELCAFDRSAVDDSWNAETRRELEQAFAKTGLGASDSLLEQALSTFDSYADALVVGQRSACEARWVEHRQTDAQFELRMACLDQRERELRASVEALVEVETSSLPLSFRVMRELGDISMCEELGLLEDGVPVPKDPRTAGGIADAREDLVRAHALRELGHLDDARLLASDVQARAKLFDYAPLRGEVEFLMASNAARALDWDTAGSAALETIRVATIIDDDRLSTDAWLLLAKVRGMQEGDPRDALSIAAAHVEHLGNLPEHRFHLHRTRAQVYQTQGKYTASVGELDLAVLVAEQGFTGSEAELVDALAMRANGMSELGNYSAARSDLERAIALGSGLGADNPQVLDAEFNLAVTELENGEAAEAEVLFRRTLVGFERVYGPSYEFIGHAHLALAQLAIQRSEYTQAQAQIDQALLVFGDQPTRISALDAAASLAAQLGEFERSLELLGEVIDTLKTTKGGTEELAYYHGRLGVMLLDAGQFEAAIAASQQALDTFDSDALAIDRVPVLLTMGVAHHKLGELELGRAALERAVELSPPDSGIALYAGEVRISLAELLRDKGERASAQREARSGRELLASVEETSVQIDLIKRANALIED